MELSNNKLLSLNQRGLFPAPSETASEFTKRVEQALNCSSYLSDFPLDVKEWKTTENFPEALELSDEIYGIQPDWVPLFFSNESLSPWQGACSWLHEPDEKPPILPVLQLRESLEKEKSLLSGYYTRTEILTHEFCHVGRSAFNEPQFEELLAYRSSSRSIRRWLGGLIQAPWEAVFFLIITLSLIIGDVILMMFDQAELLYALTPLKLLPIGLFGLALGRSLYRHRQLCQAEKKLEDVLGSQKKARAVVYRLADREIKLFARWSKEEILRYIESQNELRWQVIRLMIGTTLLSIP